MRKAEKYFPLYFGNFRENPEVLIMLVIRWLEYLHYTWNSLPYPHRSSVRRFGGSSSLEKDICFIRDIVRKYGFQNPYIESYLECKIFGYKDPYPWQGETTYFPSLFCQIQELDIYLHGTYTLLKKFSNFRMGKILKKIGSPMVNGDNKVFIVSFDMVGSEKIREEDSGKVEVAECMLCLSDALYHSVVREYKGLLEITGGDGLICLFKDAKFALQATIKILDSFAETGLSFRVGMDYGNIWFGSGIFHYSSDLVDSTRAQSRAGKNCCLITEEAFNKIHGALQWKESPSATITLPVKEEDEKKRVPIGCWRSDEIVVIDRGIVNFKHNISKRIFELLLPWQLKQIEEIEKICTAL